MFDLHARPTNPGVSAERLLAEELLHDTLIGGRTGLGRVVTWCVPLADEPGRPAVDDVSAMAVFVPADRLVAGEAEELISHLAERQAAMVLAWSHHTVTARSLASAARAADEVGLPLLRLPPRATFQVTSRLIATKILAQSTHVLEYGTRVHRTLGDVFSRGGGLPALAHSMSQLSNTSVLVLASNGELLASGATPACERRAPGFGQRVAEVLAHDLTPHLLLDEPDHGATARVITVEVDAASVQVIACPLVVAGEPYGVLALVEPERPVREHDLAQHMVVAEQGVSLAASELLRQQSVREAEERARNDFVHALLHGRFTDQLELAARAEHYQFPLDGCVAVFIVTATGLRPDDPASRRRAREAARAAQSVLPGEDLLTLTALVGSMLVLVRQVTGECAADGEVAPEVLAEFGAALHRSMQHRLGDAVRIAYGRPGVGAPGAAQSYREARTAEALARRVGTGAVTAYSELRVFAAIQAAASSPAGLAFAREILTPLQQADGQTGSLEEVVHAYIAESGNLNATARRLHLHRNTMLYKLDRASRVLHMDIRTTEAQFMIWLAHHIKALSEVDGALEGELAPPR